MIKLDCHGYCLHNDNKGTILQTQDGRPEWQFTKLIAAHINSQNHLVKTRAEDWSIQERAKWLLEGNRDEISMVLRLGEWDGEHGFFVNLPRNRYMPDHLLADLLRKYLSCIPEFVHFDIFEDKSGSNVAKKAPLLLPPRNTEVQRPARCELVIGSLSQDDWQFWLAPPTLRLFSQQLSKAVNEFDDLVHKLESLEKPAEAITVPETSAEPEKPEEKVSKSPVKARVKLKLS